MELRHLLLLNRFWIVLLSLSMCPIGAFAAWSGPQVVVQGTWGVGDNQFGITFEDTADMLPNINLTSEHKIIVRDGTNSRVKVYNSSGVLESIVTYRVNRSYKELTTADLYGFTGDFVGYGDGSANYYYRFDQKTYINFSPTGQIIKTYTERPLELGSIYEKRLNSTQTKITVQYQDRTWSYIDVGRMPSYMRDVNGNLYGYGRTQVIRYSTCGRQIASLIMMKTIEQEESRGPQIEPKVTVLEEYGQPVIAPNGDVYAWKRTPDTYSILKWTWVDDPNVPAGPDAPTELTVVPSSTGLYLTWTASPQDPGCVTGYEVVRATSAGGVTTIVATVDKGVVKYNDTTAEVGTTYYYKVKAMAGSDASPYTAEVSGKR